MKETDAETIWLSDKTSVVEEEKWRNKEEEK